MKKSRSGKIDYFYSLCGSDAIVLDVGVANNEHDSSVNLFLNTFRLKPEQYTGLAIVSMEGIQKKHPGKMFVEYPGGLFPFADQQFDWVFSNAVIEHVGDQSAQIEFINEMLRVSKNVFFTTPNKYFPIESHTNTFFRHWIDKWFYQWCIKNQPSWTRNNLLLLGYRDLKKIMNQSNAEYFSIRKNRVLGYPMTFTIVCK